EGVDARQPFGRRLGAAAQPGLAHEQGRGLGERKSSDCGAAPRSPWRPSRGDADEVGSAAYFTSKIFLARSSTDAGVFAIMVANFCASSPVEALMSMSVLAASARNAGSFMVASKARRSASTRSAGTSGVVT